MMPLPPLLSFLFPGSFLSKVSPSSLSSAQLASLSSVSRGTTACLAHLSVTAPKVLHGSLHTSQLPLSGNQRALEIVKAQHVITILGWLCAGGDRRTLGTGGSPHSASPCFHSLPPVCVDSPVSSSFSASISALPQHLPPGLPLWPQALYLLPAFPGSSCCSSFDCYALFLFPFLVLVSACLFSSSVLIDLGTEDSADVPQTRFHRDQMLQDPPVTSESRIDGGQGSNGDILTWWETNQLPGARREGSQSTSTHAQSDRRAPAGLHREPKQTMWASLGPPG